MSSRARTKATSRPSPLNRAERVAALDSWWRAANYLATAQIYLRDNALLRRPLAASHIKTRLLGHWGTVPGLTLVYAHLNRLIRDTDAEMLLVVGPGHGAPGVLSGLFLEGALEKIDRRFARNAAGVERFARAFSWPGGFASHVNPLLPGTIHEGGELGYSLSHAFGASFDDPELIVACVVGDGEAETGPIAAAWHSTRFLDPARDGAVLPILHANGHKLSGPTIYARMSDGELRDYFGACGWNVAIVAGTEPHRVHDLMWDALDSAYAQIRDQQRRARLDGSAVEVRWPLIVLRTPKGWTGPKSIDGSPVEGTPRAHQVPIKAPRSNPDHLRALEQWLQSYGPDALFDEKGRPNPSVASLTPRPQRRLGRSRRANAGAAARSLRLPRIEPFALDVPTPGSVCTETTRVLGRLLRAIFELNEDRKNFRLVCPDETASNRLQDVFEVTSRAFNRSNPSDEGVARDGRVMEILSEHTCQGWLEGYLLTGRHGMFACYEAFTTIVDSMVAQHAKWLKTAAEVPWRKPIASLNYLLTSHSWRQDHNGYSHQGPGFIDTLVSKKSSVVRVYLPPDANTLLCVARHCFATTNRINLMIASKSVMPQWLDLAAAREHCERGASTWTWASTAEKDADVVLACAGDVPTLETLAAAQILRERAPRLRVRVVNVVDLFTLCSKQDHPHGLDDDEFEELFGRAAQVVFAFHGYPRVIHELLHHRPEPERFHVRGYAEEGTTTTPFDMVVVNRMSRFHLAELALERAASKSRSARTVRAWCQEQLAEHTRWIRVHGEDRAEISDWRWSHD